MSNGTPKEPIEICVLRLSSLPHGARQRASGIDARMQVLAAEQRLLGQALEENGDVLKHVWNRSPFGADHTVVDAVIVIDDLVRDPKTEPQYEQNSSWDWTWFAHMYGWAVDLLRSAEQFDGPIVVIRPLNPVETDGRLPFGRLESAARGIAFMDHYTFTLFNAIEQAVVRLRRDSEGAA